MFNRWYEIRFVSLFTSGASLLLMLHQIYTAKQDITATLASPSFKYTVLDVVKEYAHTSIVSHNDDDDDESVYQSCLSLNQQMEDWQSEEPLLTGSNS